MIRKKHLVAWLRVGVVTLIAVVLAGSSQSAAQTRGDPTFVDWTQPQTPTGPPGVWNLEPLLPGDLKPFNCLGHALNYCDKWVSPDKTASLGTIMTFHGCREVACVAAKNEEEALCPGEDLVWYFDDIPAGGSCKAPAKGFHAMRLRDREWSSKPGEFGLRTGMKSRQQAQNAGPHGYGPVGACAIRENRCFCCPSCSRCASDGSAPPCASDIVWWGDGSINGVYGDERFRWSGAIPGSQPMPHKSDYRKPHWPEWYNVHTESSIEISGGTDATLTVTADASWWFRPGGRAGGASNWIQPKLCIRTKTPRRFRVTRSDEVTFEISTSREGSVAYITAGWVGWPVEIKSQNYGPKTELIQYEPYENVAGAAGGHTVPGLEGEGPVYHCFTVSHRSTTGTIANRVSASTSNLSNGENPSAGVSGSARYLVTFLD